MSMIAGPASPGSVAQLICEASRCSRNAAAALDSSMKLHWEAGGCSETILQEIPNGPAAVSTTTS